MNSLAKEIYLEGMDAYALPQSQKEEWLFPRMSELNQWHYEHCEEYASFLLGSGSMNREMTRLEDLPYIPTSIFKKFQLRSITEHSDPTKWKAIQSSSTSSGIPSQIFVDEETSIRQKKSVQLIFNSHLGTHRRPYLIFDAIETARGKNSLSARGAAIMSLMGYASQFFFVMDLVEGKLVLNKERLRLAVDAAVHAGEFIAYGFTYILYEAHQMLHSLGLQYEGFNENTHLIHSGGWKKMESMSVNKELFNASISSKWSILPSQVIDFYGLVEQTGVIYPDCSYGNKHVPYYAEVFIRDPHTLMALPTGETGLIQLLNLIPLSSPNHSVITDDLGKIMGTDSCLCGRKGKYFRFMGRAPKADLRGCGDVYAEGNV